MCYCLLQVYLDDINNDFLNDLEKGWWKSDLRFGWILPSPDLDFQFWHTAELHVPRSRRCDAPANHVVVEIWVQCPLGHCTRNTAGWRSIVLSWSEDRKSCGTPELKVQVALETAFPASSGCNFDHSWLRGRLVGLSHIKLVNGCFSCWWKHHICFMFYYSYEPHWGFCEKWYMNHVELNKNKYPLSLAWTCQQRNMNFFDYPSFLSEVLRDIWTEWLNNKTTNIMDRNSERTLHMNWS